MAFDPDSIATAPARPPSEARERVLRAASDLFYRVGIHSVGVDRIVSEAGVTRATFYRHFPSKEDLVGAYLEREQAALGESISAEALGGLSPERALEHVIDGIAADITHQHTRGCPFINAAAEYPDETGPVRRAIAGQRELTRSALQSVLEAAGRNEPEERSRMLVLLRDAAFVGGYLDGPQTIDRAYRRAARAAAGL